jgi:hypothetical protein
MNGYKHFEARDPGPCMRQKALSLKANSTEDNVSDNLKLDAIIITSKNYLDKTWGEEKLFDPSYKKIKP